MSIQVTSTAFSEGQSIPQKYSGQGEDISPPLKWSPPPAGTKSLALVVEDPDAPLITFTHWSVYNLPPDKTSLPEGVSKSEMLADGSEQGKNSFLKIGYAGPLPPTKKPHRYFFKMYALDTTLDLEPGAGRKQLLRAMDGHVLDEGQLMGIYQKR